VQGQRFYERPVSSGNLWYENGLPAGRLVSGKIDETLEHVAFEAPLTSDQIVAKKLADMQEQNAKLAAELALIKREQVRGDAKQAVEAIETEIKGPAPKPTPQPFRGL